LQCHRSSELVSRFRDAGDSALLLEWDEVIDPRVNGQAIAVAAAVRDARLPGVRDVVSTYRSVAVFFDPLSADPQLLRDALTRLRVTPLDAVRGHEIEVPVTYGGETGPDLPVVAEWAGLSTGEVARRHANVEYRVFMLGFLPGFGYLGSVDDRIAAPRRDTPRLRVPTGSVGIAGKQSGIYPRASPGGWQIVGWSPIRMFDPDRVPSAVLAPGDVVRFVPMTSEYAASEAAARTSEARAVATPSIEPSARAVTVVRPGLFTTIQDRGRWGHQGSGVSVSGAIDVLSHRIANILVGNPDDAATLEVTIAGPELRVEQASRIAVTGADLQATIDGIPAPPGSTAVCRPGSVLRFGERKAGARAYVAFDGGVDVAPLLGSRATHVGAALGGLEGRALAAGDRLPLGTPMTTPASRTMGPKTPKPAGGARLRVLPGPQDDFFAEPAFAVLERTRFTVTPHSNRMGYRLSGGVLPRLPNREMISDAAFMGAIQVPASGEPFLLMSDRQTTGGYPQMAIVITADLPLAGQLAPGDWIEFSLCTRAEAIAALRDQEAMLDGIT
jgi:KipI family sensor histidine kinase inhibitor